MDSVSHHLFSQLLSTGFCLFGDPGLLGRVPPVKVGQECLRQQDDQPGENFKQGMMAEGEYNKQLSVVAMNRMARDT